MRRLPIGGTGWLVLAAAATPIIIKAAKPLARKIGEAMEKVGQKLQDEAKADVRNKDKDVERPTETKSEDIRADQTAVTDPETAAPVMPETPEPPAATATKVPQAKPKPKSPIKPKPKKTVKSSTAKPRTASKKPPEA